MVNFKEGWRVAKAKAQGMTLSEYDEYKRELHEVEMAEKKVYAKEMIAKKYAQKRISNKHGLSGFSSGLGNALDKMASIGNNVQQNLEREQANRRDPFQNFGFGQSDESGQPRKRRRH
jgi:hypothetical protein